MELTEQQRFIVGLVYTTSFGSLAVLALLWLAGRLPRWIAAYYLGAFVLCAAGWEIWWTYGWVDGQAVTARRPEALNVAIPPLLNWLGNSLGDAAGIALLGLGLARWICGRHAFDRWRWTVFGVLLSWFVAQNLLVELFVYHGQVGGEARLSWAPLSPFGPWWNPVLFELDGRTVRFQNQLPWALMTPLLYGLAIRCRRRWPSDASA